MFKWNNLYAIIYKSWKDVLKNKAMIMINFMFPLLAILFSVFFSSEEAQEPILSFCTMNVVMIPILIMSSIIAEEKEKGTLRSLIFANVKPAEYLIGVSIVIFVLILISSCSFIILLPVNKEELPLYINNVSLSAITSILIGATVGLCAENQLKIGATAAPISMVIGMLPIFAEVNVFIKFISSFFYSSVLNNFLIHKAEENRVQNIFVYLFNILIIFILFYVIYRRKGLCEEK